MAAAAAAAAVATAAAVAVAAAVAAAAAAAVAAAAVPPRRALPSKIGAACPSLEKKIEFFHAVKILKISGFSDIF